MTRHEIYRSSNVSVSQLLPLNPPQCPCPWRCVRTRVVVCGLWAALRPGVAKGHERRQGQLIFSPQQIFLPVRTLNSGRVRRQRMSPLCIAPRLSLLVSKCQIPSLRENCADLTVVDLCGRRSFGAHSHNLLSWRCLNRRPDLCCADAPEPRLLVVL